MFKAGFYEVDITPPLYLNMAGYPNVRLAETVLDNLYARAAVFEQGGTKVAILTVDMCSLQQSEISEIYDRVEKYTDIKRENILSCANHTHKGYPYFAKYAEDKTVRALREIFICRAADCIILANQKLEDCKVKYGEESESTVAKNRDYLMKDGTVRTNPGRLNPNIVKNVGNIDPSIPVLFFETADGTPKGAVFSYSCHQDSVGLEKGYSGDYASLISKKMKKQYGDDFVCVFLLGCCGDINHVDVTRDFIDKQYREIADKLFPKIVSAIENSEEMKDPELANIKEPIHIDYFDADAQMLEDRIKVYSEMKTWYWIRDMINLYLKEDRKDGLELRVQCIKIGDCLIYAVPGEVFVDFQLEIKENSPTKKNIFASLANGSSGYIPTPEVFENLYSYEAIPRGYAQDTGVRVKEKIMEIAKKMF